MEVTFSDRQKAKRVIEDLVRDHTQTKIGKLINLPKAYICYALSMRRRRDNEGFACPKAAIAKILEYGKLLGMWR